MTTLLTKFKIDLDQGNSDIHGPMFHRWLPDGVSDRIQLDTNDPTDSLFVWFERFGYTDGTWVRFDKKRREVDPDIMDRQGRLYAGPLFGMLELLNVEADAIGAIQSGDVSIGAYKDIAKRVATKLLYPILSHFIRILRLVYGQYWIAELTPWDSRTSSLGYYCADRLGLKWSLDNGQTWAKLDPDPPNTVRQTFASRLGGNYCEYLTRHDWDQIPQLAKYPLPSYGHIVLRSHELADNGNVGHALVEAVTALELAVDEYMRERATTKDLKRLMEPFYNLPLRTQMAVSVASLKALPPDTIELAAKAIETRNRIVHEGQEPSPTAEKELHALFRVIAELGRNSTIKFPSANGGNRSAPDEAWRDCQEMRVVPNDGT